MSRDRFDKFTEGARRVLTLAQEEARRFNHTYIGPEHLLLGLLREGDGVAARVLGNLGVDLDRVRSAVEGIIGRSDQAAAGDIGLTPQAKNVIELAVDESRRLGHHYVGTEHLLLGLVREGGSVAAGVLESLGVNLENVRTQAIQVLSQGNGPGAGTTQGQPSGDEQGFGARADRFDKFTERARKVLTLAQEEATRFNHNYIGTEHLLLGLLREGEGVAAKVLGSLGVELSKARSAVEFIIGRGDRMIVGEIGLTPRAKKVIELAVDEARRLGHHYIGTEHLLLGLVREGEGIAAGVLESLGVNLEKARTQTMRVLGMDTTSEADMDQQSQTSASGVQEAPGVFRPPVRWEYLVVEVAYPGQTGGGMVTRVNGEEDVRFGVNKTPIHEALQTLGVAGWELVAIDASTRARGPSGHNYVFRRPF